jgi:hypothetical protein
MRRRWLGLPLALLLLGCADDGGDTDAKPGSDLKTDSPVCGKRPPTIDDCHPPPNMYSQDLYFCNCTGYCGGGPNTAACHVQIGDCRIFYDSCVPMTYQTCDPVSVTQDYMLGGLCGDCFFREAGGIPDHCDKLSKMGDPSLPADSGPKDAPAAVQ